MVIAAQTWAIDNGEQVRELVEKLVPEETEATLQHARFIRDALTGSSFRQQLFEKQGLVQRILTLSDQMGDGMSSNLLGVLASILTLLFPRLELKQQREVAPAVLAMANRLQAMCDDDQSLACTAIKCLTAVLDVDPASIPEEAYHLNTMLPFLTEHLKSGPGSRTVVAACAAIKRLANHAALAANPLYVQSVLEALQAALSDQHQDPVHLLHAAHALLEVLTVPVPPTQPTLLATLTHAVQPFVEHTHAHVRMAAIACLLKYPDELDEGFIRQQILPRLTSLLRPEVETETRASAAAHLGTLLNQDNRRDLANNMDYLDTVADVLKPKDGAAKVPPIELTKGALMILAAVSNSSESMCSQVFDKSYTSKLQAFLRSPHPAVRLAAAVATRKISRSVRAVKSDLMRSNLVNDVCKLLSDSSTPIRREAMAAFANLCLGAAISPLQSVDASTWTTVRHMLDDDDEDTRFAAFLACQNVFKSVDHGSLEAARRVLAELDVKQLLQAYRHNGSTRVRAAAAGLFRNLACNEHLIKEVRNCVEGAANLIKEFVEPLFESTPDDVLVETVYVLCNLCRVEGEYAAALSTRYKDAVKDLLRRLVNGTGLESHNLQLAAARTLTNLMEYHKQQGNLSSFLTEFQVQSALDAVEFPEPEVRRHVELLQSRFLPTTQ